MAHKKLTNADLKRMEDLSAAETQKAKQKKEIDAEKKIDKQKQSQIDKQFKSDVASKNPKKAAKDGGGGNVKMKTKFNAEGNQVLQRKVKNLQGGKKKGEDHRIRNLLRENEQLKQQIKMLMMSGDKKCTSGDKLDVNKDIGDLNGAAADNDNDYGGKTPKTDYLGLPVQLINGLVYLKKDMDDQTDSDVKNYILNIGKSTDELHAEKDDVDQMQGDNDRGELSNSLIGIYGRIDDLNTVNNINYVNKKEENTSDGLKESVNTRHTEHESDDNYDEENKETEKLEGNKQKVINIRNNLINNANNGINDTKIELMDLSEKKSDEYNESKQEEEVATEIQLSHLGGSDYWNSVTSESVNDSRLQIGSTRMPYQNRISSCTSFISSRSQELFRTFFFWLGVRIYRKPWLFILIGAFITICCSLGILLFNEEVQNFYLWCPQESDIWGKFENMKKEYGISPKMTLLLTMNNESESILSAENMDLSYGIFNKINNIRVNEYNYTQLCLRSYPTSPICISDYSNIFGFFFGSNPLLWQNNTQICNTINSGGHNSPIYGFAGGLKMDNMHVNIHSANSLLFIYELQGSINKDEADIIYEYMGAFQDYWSVHKNDYNEINIEYATYRSLDDEVSRVILGDFHIMVTAIAVMAIYLMITLGSFSCYRARVWLAASAILVLICAMGVGFGIAFMFGTTFNIICIFVAYILLGVGVDDMIIIVDTYESMKEYGSNNEMRLAKTLSESGLSISLTSLCTTMAFSIGSTTDLPAISAFCAFAAWCFFANYILQFLLFVPLMVYDNKRISKGNNFCCPYYFGHDIKKEQKNDTKKENKFKMSYFVMKLCVIPVLAKRFGRWIIIFVFLFVLYGSIYVSFSINTESDDSKLVPDDSYMLDYIDAYEQNFGDIQIADLNIIIHNQDFSDVNVRRNTYDFIDELNNNPKAIGQVHHWLDAFANYTLNTMTNLTNLNDLTDSEVFYNYLESFCDDAKYIQWHSEICYNDFHNNDKRTGMASTRFFLSVSKSANRGEQWDECLDWNAICQSYFGSGDCYIFEPEYTFAYLVSSIQKITIENMAYAAIGVFSILCLFLDLRMAFFCLIMVVMIDIDLFGWMWLLNISLDVVSYTELVMAAGLTVDYIIHIVHAITDSNDNNSDKYEEKIECVMYGMGSSVVKGALTTFLGAVALVLSQSEAFRIFFFMFVGIIIIALLHSILLVPALLGEFKCMLAPALYQQVTGISDTQLAFDRSYTNLDLVKEKGKGIGKFIALKKFTTL